MNNISLKFDKEMQQNRANNIMLWNMFEYAT